MSEKTNLHELIQNAKKLEQAKFQEHKDADERCHGSKSMLNEYNMRGFNPHYATNVLSKWLEELLLDGDAVVDDRLSDLILREVEKPVADYCKFIDTPDSHFNKLSHVLYFKGATTTSSSLNVKEETETAAVQECGATAEEEKKTQSEKDFEEPE